MRPTRFLLAALLVVATAGCGTSGTDLREPPAGVTSPAPTSSTTATTPPVFTITSPAFAIGGELPAVHTCAGDDLSPALTFNGVPPGTVELALTVTNPVAGSVYWILAGMAPGTTELSEGSVPLEAIEGPNSSGEFGWAGPCPEPGETQQIELTLHALTGPSALEPDMTATEALTYLQGLPATRTIVTATATGS